VGARFTYRPSGPFSLAAAKRFLDGFPGGDPPPEGEDLVWAFLSDEGEPVAVRVQQKPKQVAAEVVVGDVDEGRLRAQVARLLSLHVDGEPYEELDDPVIAAARARHPGLRPVHFPTPYEAAVWAILSHRTRRVQAGNIRRWLAEHHGTELTFDGVSQHTAVAPEVLVDLRRIPGVPGPKLPWLRDVARAALDGDLDPEHLLAMEPAQAVKALQRIDGIGPFSAELVLVRGAGHPDVFAEREPLLRQLIVQHYGEVDPIEVADRWAPRRSWASFILRQAASSTPLGRHRR
jgi:DNA-3-methyladenine glycosylase II